MLFNIFPKVSIIMPVHTENLKFLEQSLNSISDLNYPLYLLDVSIVFDDSCNTTNDIIFIEKISSTFKIDIQYESNSTNKGIGYNRNMATDKCKGDYVFFLDCDDVIPRNSIRDLSLSIITNNALIAYGNHKKKNHNLNETLFERNKEGMHKILTEWKDSQYNPIFYFSFMAPGILIKKSLFESVNGFRNDLKEGELIDFLIRVVCKCDISEISYVNSLTYIYRDNPLGTNTLKRKSVISNNESNILSLCNRLNFKRSSVRYGGTVGQFNSTFYSHYDINNNRISLPYTWP